MRPVPVQDTANGYAHRNTSTATRTVPPDASDICDFGPARGRIQVVIGTTSTATYQWGVGTRPQIAGVTVGIVQQSQSGQIILNRALMGSSIDDDIWVLTTAGASGVIIETKLVDG